MLFFYTFYFAIDSLKKVTDVLFLCAVVKNSIIQNQVSSFCEEMMSKYFNTDSVFGTTSAFRVVSLPT